MAVLPNLLDRVVSRNDAQYSNYPTLNPYTFVVWQSPESRCWTELTCMSCIA